MNISILYFSVTGTTRKMAAAIAMGCNKELGVTAKTMSIEDLDENFLRDSPCVIFGTPTYYAAMAPELQIWLNKKSIDYMLSGKLGGAFATADYIHGGADLAIQGILTHLMCSGMMTYSGGCACGNPPIHLGPVAISKSIEDYEEIFELYGMRMAQQVVKHFF